MKACGTYRKNGVVEEDGGPWGALVIIEAKPHPENGPWHEYQWRMCVTYQKLNQTTIPFTFPIPSCDDEAQDIGTEANNFIAVDMGSAYWQVVIEEEAQ